MDYPMTTMLHGTVEMPMHGLGVFKTKDGDEVINAILWALEAGYRLIDTAKIYENEEGVGEAIRRSGIERDEIFVTTKLWNSDQGYESGLAAAQESLDKLGLGYVDLYLIHWPKPDRTADSWRALEKLQADGAARAIGVSNFEPHHLDQLMVGATVAPAVNQVELHPNLQQMHIRAADDALGTITQAWSPLKQAQVLGDPVIAGLADKHGKTPAQIVIRHQLQEGISTIPKSIKQHRIIENGAVLDFELDDQDVEAMRTLDNGDRIGPHPDEITF